MSLQKYLKELEQEPFEAEEFVERVAWRVIAETKQENDSDDGFNPILLHDAFVDAIKDLTLLQERQHKKCERLEAAVRDDETHFRRQVHNLQEDNKTAAKTFRQLDEKINHVATKVLHLGDQLDSVNAPRSRVVEAQRLMAHLNGFITSESDTLPLYSDPTRIDEAADIIQKLYIIAQDLPTPKFLTVNKRIEKKYDEIERALIEEFATKQRRDDLKRMKEIANVLSQFKGYSQCIDAYIEQSQGGCLLIKDVFSYLLPLCEKNNQIINEVFKNPDQVMSKFILNIYHLKLNEYITNRLSQNLDTYNFLCVLFDLYSKTNQLSSNLAALNIGYDINFMSKLTDNIFNKHIDNYIELELKNLKARNSSNLQKYYESKNHQKKPIQTGGFQDLKRDLQAVIATRANINIAQIENYGGETFLSEELAITILQDAKLAFQRCALLSRPDERSQNATQILDRLLNCLLSEHVDYALDLGLQAIPVVEGGRNLPELYFFTVVHQTNNITHLLEKQFSDIVVPLVINTPRYNDCVQKKKFVMEDIERKVNTGMDRSLNAILTWVKLYLQVEQKKTDYKPETDDFTTMISPPCKVVVQYINSMIQQIKANLDGNNVNAVLQELGIRLHRTIYDHMLQFQYNTAGAMVAICDLNEYRSCAKPLGPLVTKLFETLHALCNLLLVKPENLQQICSEDSLVDLDRSVVHNFIQLRSDFKSQKQTILKI